jgi:hypothetical protein
MARYPTLKSFLGSLGAESRRDHLSRSNFWNSPFERLGWDEKAAYRWALGRLAHVPRSSLLTARTSPLRYCDPTDRERSKTNRTLQFATGGVHRHIRRYGVARTHLCVEACPARCAHRRGRHPHVRRSHAWGTGTVAIRARQRIEDCWRRAWWNCPSAATAGASILAPRETYCGVKGAQ